MERCRPAARADLDRIVTLARAMRAELGEMRGGTVWLARDARAEPLEDEYGALIGRDDARLLVGTLDDVVVGFCALEIETLRTGARLGRVTDLYVEPEARAVSVGETMMDDALAFCRAHDCIGVDAWALPGHRATKNFFEEHGFTARALVMHRPAADGG